MYYLVWANFDNDKLSGAVTGNSDSLFQIFFYFLKNQVLDVLELYKLEDRGVFKVTDEVSWFKPQKLRTKEERELYWKSKRGE